MSRSFPTLSTPAGAIPDGSPSWNRQRASQMPSHRYSSVFDRVAVPLTERSWPTEHLTRAPLWVPVDLRDGNQALAEPMDPQRKRRFFELLVAMGYKEIEVGYPSASETDFEFVRLIARTDLAPEDVTIVVFTAARRDLIERTIASIRGIRNPVVVHVYTATAPMWRDVVLGRGRDELKRLILDAGRDVLELAGDLPNVRFQFSPEVFNLTEPDYVLEVCDAMTTLWDAAPERPVILNLPATVEVATPNVYADQIEYMHRHLARRDGVILSVHPHNDRGTGIACAELAVLAGAQRVEGCVFGNGERTGNVDIATLALNLHAQGIDPMIDFSDIDEIRRTVEYCTGLPVHPRHPYAGDLVYTAFSGSHQDAIKKGLEDLDRIAAEKGVPVEQIDWQAPYLPIDPKDVGRTYEAVIRVNSQSGKGGVAYIMKSEHKLDLPRRLQIEFSRAVQHQTDDEGGEMSADAIWEAFSAEYLEAETPLKLNSVHTSSAAGVKDALEVNVYVDGEVRTLQGAGNGPIAAFVDALSELPSTDGGYDVRVLDYAEHALSSGGDAIAAAYVECVINDQILWGVGLDPNIVTASLKAVISAINRAARVRVGA
jgi:2-isopropylmalate synthase